MNISIRWPAEWEPQAAVMLTWPHPAGDFADFAAIHTAFVDITTALAAHARVLISVADEGLRRQVQQAVAALAARVQIHIVPSDDIWVRDHGPIGVLIDSRVQLNKYVFDGWGGKYPATRDNALALHLSSREAFAGLGEMHTEPLTLEGGAIETDGQGVLIATRSSVLDPRRNPGISQAEMENRLTESLGIKQFIWLDNGDLEGDDTDGHIDTLVRFVAPGHLVYQASDSPESPNHHSLTRMGEELRTLRQANGKPFRLTALPHTQQAHHSPAGVLPTSYANFLFLNDALLVPQYGDVADEQALATLASACPTHNVLGVDCRALVTQYGSLHCATMNIPAPPS